MALTLNVNSYATTQMAASYFEDRIDVAAWEAASEPQRSQALVTASMMLNEIRWVGSSTSQTQKLAFPRAGAYYDTMLEAEIVLDSAVVPVRILEATYELAYHLLNNDGLLDSAGAISNLQVGSIKIETIIAPARFPSTVRRLFGPLVVSGAESRSWWRAN
jgi:hypothetical protein